MAYKINAIESESALFSVEPFTITHTLWSSKESPISYGRLGYIPNTEVIIQLVSNQSNPLRTYHEPNSPVYKDSALEFFFQAELENPNYLNFEINANGAMLLQWGNSQTNRTYLPMEQLNTCPIKAQIEENSWNVILHIPLTFLHELYPNLTLTRGHSFRFNLYKICETPEYEHYMSLSSIPTATPNFHQPQYFADGIFN